MLEAKEQSQDDKRGPMRHTISTRFIGFQKSGSMAQVVENARIKRRGSLEDIFKKQTKEKEMIKSTEHRWDDFSVKLPKRKQKEGKFKSIVKSDSKLNADGQV